MKEQFEEVTFTLRHECQGARLAVTLEKSGQVARRSSAAVLRSVFIAASFTEARGRNSPIVHQLVHG